MDRQSKVNTTNVNANALSQYFSPSAEIRAFDGTDYIGKQIEIGLAYQSDDRSNIVFKLGPLHLNGYIPLARDSSSKDRDRLSGEIKDVYLVQQLNGGRSDHWSYASYDDYFSEKRKALLQQEWNGGLLEKIQRGGGDNDSADMIIGLSIGGLYYKFEARCYELVYPREWYSEAFKNLPGLLFEEGFYSDAHEAIAGTPVSFGMFGERYFPIICLPAIEDNFKLIRDIASHAKNCSPVIVAHDRLIVGTRCKPDEVSSVIQGIYDVGGSVPINQYWDWD